MRKAATTPPRQDDKIDDLRRQLAQLTSGGTAAARSEHVVPLGLAAIDHHLGGGLVRDALHEIAGTGLDQEQAVLPAFLAVTLQRRLAGKGTCRNGTCLWVARHQDLYGPGLHSCGVAPADLLLVTSRNDQETLWVMEEAIRAAGIACVIGEIDGLDLTSSRRLQLAAENHGCMVLALRRGRHAKTNAQHQAPIAAATRWKILPAPSLSAAPRPGLGDPCWRLELWRRRNGPTGSWTITLHEQELRHVEEPTRSNPSAIPASTAATAVPIPLAASLDNRSLATAAMPTETRRAVG